MKTTPASIAWLAVLAAVCVPSGLAFAQNNELQAANAQEELAAKARAVFETHCYECHGGKQEAPDFNVKLYGTVVGTSFKYVVAKNLDDSSAFQRMADGTMPPEGKPRPTEAEVALVREWIEKGAIKWPDVIAARAFVTDIDVLSAIRDDLRSAPSEDRSFMRYFSLHNLHNNWPVERIGKTAPVDADILNLARAAISKACNSMSWQNQIAVPKIVDKNGVVLRIDLRDFGWDKNNQWATLLRAYPYGLQHNKSRDPAIQQMANEVTELSGSGMPCVRLDWFIDSATRPTSYKALLELPNKIDELEKKLNVDVQSDFLRDRLARAGFAESGVSRNNRLVDRHPAAFGAYWKSYDFAKSEDRGDLFKFPLGPEFDKNDFNRQAFKHDGGEMIFNLPNGLQGYYLSKANGEELLEGPIEIVRDLQETGGTAKVLNGISCMACHTYGMKRFNDTIREGLGVSGDALLKVDRLFPTKERMDKLLDQDEERFLRAAAAATATFLNPADPESITPAKLKNYKEPVGLIARMYQKDLSLEEAAFELGFQNPAELKTLIANNSTLQNLGMGPLANGASIKRDKWAFMGADGRTRSTFHRAATELNRGTPFKEL